MFKSVARTFFLVAVAAAVGAQPAATLADQRDVAAPRTVQDIPANDEAGDADSKDANAFRTNVANLFNQEKFDQLDEIANEVRSQKSRFPGGAWKSHVFYSVLREPGSLTATDQTWNVHFERLQRWIERNPDSITPDVALAASYLRFAWKARGKGYANTVTADGWRLFAERVQKARDVLEQAQSLATRDPEWYRTMQTVSLAQGWHQKQAEELFAEANSVEPGYYYFDEAFANYLLPKWYGKPGDSEEFAQSIAERIGGAEGDSVYFRIALSLNCCKAQPQVPSISWERVKQGFASSKQLYGSTNYQRNAVAFMALRQGDREYAQQLFARIGDNWNERVWRSKDNFDRSKSSLTLKLKGQD